MEVQEGFKRTGGIKINPIHELYAIGDKLPLEVQMDIDKRNGDWMVSGGKEDDPYVWQQLRYAQRFIRSDGGAAVNNF